MTRMFARIPPWVIALALIAIPHFVYLLLQWHRIPIHDGKLLGPTDPDPWLRLTLVREWLTSGNWYNHLVAHSNAPLGGTTSPWTRPLDLIIAVLVKLQPSAVPLDTRLLHAALMLPWIWMTLLLVGCYRLVRLIARIPSAYLMTSLLIAATPTTWNYFGLGNADHHAPLAVLFVWGLYGVFAPDASWRQRAISGVLFGIQLWISVEALILVGVLCAWYGLQWLRDDHAKMRQLFGLLAPLTLTVAAATAIERPSAEWLVPVYDSISVVYVYILALATVLAGLLARLSAGSSLHARVTASGVGGAALGYALYAVFPRAFGGPMAEVDPYIISDFLPRISEARTLFTFTPPYVAASLLQPLLALGLCALTWWKPSAAFYDKPTARLLGFFVATLTVLFIAQVRWSYYLLPLTAVAIAPVLGALFTPEHAPRWVYAQRLARLSEGKQALWRLPIILAVLVLPIALKLLHVQYEKHSRPAADQARLDARTACYKSARQLIYSGKLNEGPMSKPHNLLAPTDLGAEILFFTPHRIVASNYHREGPGIRYVWEADKIDSAETLQSYLAERNVEALLLCPVTKNPETSILQTIYDGNQPLPDWLKRIPLDTPTTTSKNMPVLLRISR